MLDPAHHPIVGNLSFYLLDPQLMPFELQEQARELSQFAEHCGFIAPDRVLETFSRFDAEYGLARQRLLHEPI